MDDISEEEGGATVKGGWDRSCAILHCYCKLAYIVELFFSKLSNKLSITCAWGWGGGDYWILIFLVNSPPPPPFFPENFSRQVHVVWNSLFCTPSSFNCSSVCRGQVVRFPPHHQMFQAMFLFCRVYPPHPDGTLTFG